MLKSLIIWSSIVPSLTLNYLVSNVLIVNNGSEFYFQSKAAKVVHKNLIIDDFDEVNNRSRMNSNPQATSQDLHINGSNKDTHFRIYIDSSGDKSLPPSPIGKTNDYSIGKGKKETWYNHLIPGISINVKDYAKDKADFLKKYRVITFSYAYNYNFWNSKMGWSHDQGKNTPLVTALVTYELVSHDINRLIFERREASHANNESAKLELKQEWVGETLKYNFYLGVSYNWKPSSPIKHASFASFTADLYSFIFVPEKENEKTTQIQYLNAESGFIFDYYASINLIDLDNKLQAKARQKEISDSSFKTVCLFAYGYYGTQNVGGTTYVYSVMIRSAGGLGSRDSSLILNGFNRTRELSQIYQNGNLSFSYLNSLNQKEEISFQDVSAIYLGMTLTGLVYAPFIYTI